MQIFEVIALKEFPFMETREVLQGQIVRDIINETAVERVFLLVDHNEKNELINIFKDEFKIFRKDSTLKKIDNDKNEESFIIEWEEDEN